MNKYLLSGFVALTFIAYVVHQQAAVTPAPLVTMPPATGLVSPTVTATSTPLVTTTPTTGKYKDGQYTGVVADAFYGNVQVQVTIAGGKLTDVQFLDYPHDRRTSQEINSQATPLLRSEAIQAQSAQVDVVSGATATSGAFIQSLQSALQQAS